MVYYLPSVESCLQTDIPIFFLIWSVCITSEIHLYKMSLLLCRAENSTRRRKIYERVIHPKIKTHPE